MGSAVYRGTIFATDNHSMTGLRSLSPQKFTLRNSQNALMQRGRENRNPFTIEDTVICVWLRLIAVRQLEHTHTHTRTYTGSTVSSPRANARVLKSQLRPATLHTTLIATLVSAQLHPKPSTASHLIDVRRTRIALSHSLGAASHTNAACRPNSPRYAAPKNIFRTRTFNIRDVKHIPCVCVCVCAHM